MKREIILALKMIGDKQAVPALNEILLNDENPFIRYDAARALGNIASTDSIFTLIKALKTDKNWMVKGACATALGKTGNKKAVNELKSILNIDAGYEASWARDRAAWALARIGDGWDRSPCVFFRCQWAEYPQKSQLGTYRDWRPRSSIPVIST